VVLAYPGNARIFFHSTFVDLRRGFEGLSFLVEAAFGEKVTSGSYFAFVNKRRELMKVIYFDGDGLAIWVKRLEKGRFGRHLGSSPLMDRRSFLMLLEGVTPRRMNCRYTHS